MNAVEIEEAVSKLAEAAFDAAEFPFAFLEAFGNKPATIRQLLSFPPKTGPLFLETEGGCDGSETTFGRRHTEAAA